MYKKYIGYFFLLLSVSSMPAERSSLHLAAISGNCIMIQQLLREKNNITAIDYCGDTPLHLAVFHGKLDAIKLLAVPACIEMQNSDNLTPLLQAVHKNNVEAVKILLSAGADICATNKCGDTPLHIAARYVYREMIGLLLRCKADAMVANKLGKKPFDNVSPNVWGIYNNFCTYKNGMLALSCSLHNRLGVHSSAKNCGQHVLEKIWCILQDNIVEP